ncbi:hypothetical protein H0B56_00700 [Haloechinothrix sp. YIM 98757]|uniref:Uncharacterized protein n=1 Tax=Haloechinothrix aidingensis TaxID=2752311 RepID=A0A838A6N5_9PSEU|nr:hypothetical protein [Haloechinothrix aidingensis]MBA0124057.1 hypothetical protein [Haloechinothrix aidingensis]
MPVYMLYDTGSGEVVGVHSEVHAGEGEQTVALTDAQVLADAMPEGSGRDIGVLEVAERPRPRRGYRLVVDPALGEVAEVETPAAT